MDDIDNSLINQIMKDSYSYYLNKNFTRTSLLEKLDQVVRAYQAQNEISQLEKKIESDLELATQVQTAMLPPWIRFTECYEFSFIYRPLFKISGDLFEWIPIDPQSCLCVFGDISGHGIHSALTMTAVQSILKQMITIHAPDELRPDRILRQLNDFIDDYGLNYYAAFSGCSAESEASFKTVTFLAGKLDELGIKTVLTIEKSDDRIAQTVIENTKKKDQKILELNSMQSITSDEIKNGVTYLSVMEDNLKVLKEALK